MDYLEDLQVFRPHVPTFHFDQQQTLNRGYLHHWRESTESRENRKTICLSSFSLAVLLMGEARELSATVKQGIFLEQFK